MTPPALGPVLSFPNTAIPACEVLDGPHKAALTQFVAGVAGKAKFPGPNPWSLERAHFKTLQTERYWAAPKTDGVRAALVCLECAGENMVVFMDRARRLWVIPGALFHVCTAWFQGTILDGEVIGSDFVAFDTPVVAGANLAQCQYSQRVAAIEQGLELHRQAHAQAATNPPLGIFIKLFAPPAEVDPASASAPGADGLVFMPEAAPYLTGRHRSLFKLKQHHTVDFQVVDAQGTLAVLTAGVLTPVAHLADGHPGMPPGSIVECEAVQPPDIWRVVSVRADKDYPNDKLTFTNTLKNMKQAIQYAEALAVSASYRPV